MNGTILALSAILAVGAAPWSALASPQDASKPAPKEQPKAADQTKAEPSPAPARSSQADERVGGQAGSVRKPRYLKMILAEFRALDLDKKTLTFETEDGKSYTVPAQVPTRQDTIDRAAKLAEVLKPGDKIRMLCKVNEREEPILILSLHMTAETAPMQYR